MGCLPLQPGLRVFIYYPCGGGTHGTGCVWKSEDGMCELNLSYHLLPWVLGLGLSSSSGLPSKAFYPQSHLVPAQSLNRASPFLSVSNFIFLLLILSLVSYLETLWIQDLEACSSPPPSSLT